jgi:dihydroorotase
MKDEGPAAILHPPSFIPHPSSLILLRTLLMPSILIKAGRLIDPSQQLDRVANLLLRDGRIAAYDAGENGHELVIDAAGKIVAPGLIDMHVHLREPGREEDETIKTGTAAAVAGGFTSIACIPNTEPPIDTQATVEFIRHQARLAGNCNVFVVACVSKNREGKELAEIGQLVESGAVAFSDDGAPVYDAELLRRAYEYCLMFDKPILNHAEVLELTRGGVMHEGLVSLKLGLAGMPAAAEDVMTGRDIVLAEATGGRIHIMHVSTAGSVELVRRAKRRGVRVTTEVCPHHFTLTDESLKSFDSNFKMSPPLRAKTDLEACIQGLLDGTIDVICTDHAPHAAEKKMQELDRAPFGIVGLETALGLVSTQLVAAGHLTWPQAIEKMTINPARVLGIEKGTLALGADADVTVIDPDYEWIVDPGRFKSKSRNTPFAGRRLRGRADTVIVAGNIKHRASP